MDEEEQRSVEMDEAEQKCMILFAHSWLANKQKALFFMNFPRSVRLDKVRNIKCSNKLIYK